jgi:hypothetical protein
MQKYYFYEGGSVYPALNWLKLEMAKQDGGGCPASCLIFFDLITENYG